jgi:hypothetical protein
MSDTLWGQVKRRWPVLVVGLIVSVVLLWFTFRDLDWGEIRGALRGANYWWLLPGVAIYFGTVWVRSWRWRFMLRDAKRVPAARLYPVIAIGYMGNNVLPFRLGEALRAYLLWRRERINIATSLTTAVLERLFDGVTMVLFVLFGLLFVPMSPFFQNLVTVASAVFFGALVIFLFLASRPRLMHRIAHTVIKAVMPTGIRESLFELVEGVIAGLSSLRSGRDVLIVFGVTLIVWIMESLIQWLVSFAFDLQVPYYGILLMGGVVNLLTALPSLPGYIGTFEGGGIQTLEAIGVRSGAAASYILVLRLVLFVPVTLLGFFFMAREGVRWAEVWQVEATKDKKVPQGTPRGEN